MADEKIVKPVEPKPTVKPATQKLVRAVYGLMVDPHTGQMFGMQPRTLDDLTPWVRSQIEADKLRLI